MDVFCQVFYIYLYFTSTNAKENEAKLLNKKNKAPQKSPAFQRKIPQFAHGKTQPTHTEQITAEVIERKSKLYQKLTVVCSFHFISQGTES